MKKIVAGIAYDTTRAQLLASNRYWDGHTHARGGRNTYLYRTRHGRYFTVSITQWEDERDTLTPVSPEEAIAAYTYALPKHEVDFTEAFPATAVTDA